MLLFGEYTSLPDFSTWKGDLFVYNLSSLRAGFERVNILPQVTEINYLDEKTFDLIYAGYIFNNPGVFYEFFYKIIFNLYNGRDVFILVTRDPFNDTISESVIKLIQQRYGYNGALINESSDIDYLNKDETFTVAGIYNLDIDKKQFSLMYMSRTQPGAIMQGLMTQHDIENQNSYDMQMNIEPPADNSDPITEVNGVTGL